MKKTTHFVMAIVAFMLITLIGCKKDNTKPDSAIIGRWQIVKSDFKHNYEGEMQTETEMAPSGSYIEFKKDGSYSGKSEGNMSGTWVIDNNRLKLKDSKENESSSFEIKKLTKAELVLFSKDVDGGYISEEAIYLKK